MSRTSTQAAQAPPGETRCNFLFMGLHRNRILGGEDVNGTVVYVVHEALAETKCVWIQLERRESVSWWKGVRQDMHCVDQRREVVARDVLWRSDGEPLPAGTYTYEFSLRVPTDAVSSFVGDELGAGGEDGAEPSSSGVLSGLSSLPSLSQGADGMPSSLWGEKPAITYCVTAIVDRAPPRGDGDGDGEAAAEASGGGGSDDDAAEEGADSETTEPKGPLTHAEMLVHVVQKCDVETLLHSGEVRTEAEKMFFGVSGRQATKARLSLPYGARCFTDKGIKMKIEVENGHRRVEYVHIRLREVLLLMSRQGGAKVAETHRESKVVAEGGVPNSVIEPGASWSRQLTFPLPSHVHGSIECESSLIRRSYAVEVEVSTGMLMRLTLQLPVQIFYGSTPAELENVEPFIGTRSRLGTATAAPADEHADNGGGDDDNDESEEEEEEEEGEAERKKKQSFEAVDL